MKFLSDHRLQLPEHPGIVVAHNTRGRLHDQRQVARRDPPNVQHRERLDPDGVGAGAEGKSVVRGEVKSRQS